MLYSLKDFASHAFSSLGLDYEKYVISSNSLKRPSEIKSGFGSPSKANKKLNWEAKTFMPEIASKMTQFEFNRLKQ